MPKRLLRYALSRLDLLDTDALDTENLDFALGRKTVFEFRDVGIKLKVRLGSAQSLLLDGFESNLAHLVQKLDKLLQLPAAISLSRAKVLLLRVTVPMDFYTSPITVDVEGVQVKLKVDGGEGKESRHKTPPADLVPNTADLAQSFLETQPSSERKQLQEALVSETQDLGASVSVSEDDFGSEDEPNAFGTGQALSLPEFLADFLQGIVDRTQISIRDVRFQLDMNVPSSDAGPSLSRLEPVSFQIALETIEVEGVTTKATEGRGPAASKIIPKEGKRHISVANSRAYLISEANVFSALTRSPPTASPSTASSSPVMTRAPSYRQSASLLSQGSFREQPMASLQESFRERLCDSQISPDLSDHPLADSEEALGIPYELDDANPPTPRDSTIQESSAMPLGSSTRPTIGLASSSEQQQESENPRKASAIDTHPVNSPLQLVTAHISEDSNDRELNIPLSGDSCSVENLNESRLYTHEEAESMYLSAFSTVGLGASATASRLVRSQEKEREQSAADLTPSVSSAAPHSARSVMPGGWCEDSGNLPELKLGTRERAGEASSSLPTTCNKDHPRLDHATASRSIHLELGAQTPETQAKGRESELDDAPTPRGPSRVAKEIMHLENVSVYVPSHHQHVNIQARTQSQSGNTQQPPFSTPYSEVLGTAASPPQLQQSSLIVDDAVEVELSALDICFDTSLGILMAMAFDKLRQAFNFEAPAATEKPPQEKHYTTRAFDLRLVAREISFNFLSQLHGVVDTPERYLSPPAFTLDHDQVLLNASMQNLSLSKCSTQAEPSGLGNKGSDGANQDAVVTRIDLERFRFGYSDGDMVSFDSNRPMSTSVRDVFLRHGHVGIKMIRSPRLNKIEVETLPLVVQLDLQRLEETFGWFGGLSSFLNMSVSSAASGLSKASSPTSKPGPPPPSRKSRPVVRFDAAIVDCHVQQSAEQSQPAAIRSKLNVRIGGALVELAGRECSVAAETSAIKVIGREEGVGVACGRICFTGPYIKNPSARLEDRTSDYRHHSHHQIPLTTEIGGLSLELWPVPEDRDLEKLLELIIPSKVKFDDGGGGEIIVETLLRQRRKGSVLRATVDSVNVRVGSPTQLLSTLPSLVEETARLSTTVAAKYLPEDDRPGILTLAGVQKLSIGVNVGGKVGLLESQLDGFEIAHITVPSLVAVAVRNVSVRRNSTEDLVCSHLGPQHSWSPSPEERGPVIMARVIGDEIEPVVKVKLRELSIEYRVPTVMDALGLDNESATPQEFEANLAASVGLADHARLPLLKGHLQSSETAGEQRKKRKRKPTALEIGLRDCFLGLNPLNLPSKLVLALTDTRVQADLGPSDGITTVAVHINKASLLLTDNAAEAEDSSTGAGADASPERRRRSASAASPQIAGMCARGFVDICYISSAKIAATLKPARGDDGLADHGKQVEVEVRDDLLVLETCADSTQTLLALFNALKPPTPPSKDDKYRTKVVPVQDLLASISAEAFGKPEGDYDFDHDFAGAQELAGSMSDAEYETGSRVLPRAGSDSSDSQLGDEALFDATAHDVSMDDTTMQDTAEGVLLTGFDGAPQSESLVDDSGDDLVIHEDFHGSDEAAGEHQTAKLWNSVKNTYDRAPNTLVAASPLKVSVKDVHVIWNLFDGYDWARTRDFIAKAVEDVETKAAERQHQQAKMSGEAYDEQDEDEETIGDFLFNSIYIGVPLNRDPRELTRAINQGLNDANDDNTTETESVAATTTAATRTAYLHHHQQSTQGGRRRSRRLRLRRSKHHKITFELRGVSADVVAYPSPEATAASLASRGGQETLSSMDVRVHTLDIFDHVPTSTWKKFATYDQDQGEREMGTSMVHVELLNVRPIPSLTASEMVMRATVLPLRLHVDQDALDFITRFFEFKDDQARAPRSSTAASDIPFLQRAEVHDIPVKLDFKPKRVDYAGLRSGHTTEFMNFVVLEEARMVLRHVIIYGVSGFDRLGKTLNDIWAPDVRRNQLPGVVAGLAPVRSLVNIGSGFRDLVEIPLKEYRRDGRIVRSISKGAAAFARTTGTELVKLGAKLAVGTQYALQGAEEMLLADREWRCQPPARRPSRPAAEGGRQGDEEEDYVGEDPGELDDEDKKQVSLYADQPTGVLQGIRGGYRSLSRDVNLARDAIIAIPGEVMESQSAGGAARVVLRRAPTIIFRPAMGVTKVIGQTLMGATNTMDPQNRRRIEEARATPPPPPLSPSLPGCRRHGRAGTTLTGTQKYKH